MHAASLHSQPNVSPAERVLTVLAGLGALALAAQLPRARGPLAAVSGALMFRGATGYCPAYAAAGTPPRALAAPATSTRDALAGSKGAHLRAATTIAQPVETVYAFWRNLDHLSMALPSSITIERIDDRRSRWSLAPARESTPTLATWTAEIINDEAEKVIGWRTVGESDIVSAGSVRFNEAPGGQGTEVSVHMQYSPPFGRVGAGLAGLFGRGADQVVTQCLRDIKRYLELGRQVTLRANPVSR
jgi:uncharacterized membrane protein